MGTGAQLKKRRLRSRLPFQAKAFFSHSSSRSFHNCLRTFPIARMTSFRDSTKKVAVFVVNVCFGWTLIGWIIAFVMAVSYEKKSDYQLRIAAMERIARQ